MRSLRSYLVGMAILLVVLLGAASAVAVRQVSDYGRAQVGRQLLDTSRALSLAMDGQVRTYESMLLAMRESEALQREDWKTFDAQARRLVAGSDAWVVVDDPNGQQQVNTRLPPGAALPHGPVPEEEWRVIRQGRTHYCNLTRGFVVPQISCVDIPVVRDGRTAYALSVIFRPRLLDRLFAGQRLQTGRFVTVVDRSGTVIWRNVSPERFIGKPATADLRNQLAHKSEGVKLSVSLEGVPTLVAYSRSKLTGWTFVVALPRGQVSALSERTLAYGLLLAAVLLLVGAGVGLAAGRRVARAIEHLHVAAARLRRGEPPAFEPSGLTEVDAVGEALDAAVREREGAQERFRLAQEVGGIGAWDWDLVRDEGHVSDTYKEMHGLSDVSGPLKVAQVKAVIHPDDLPGYEARLADARRRAEASTNEYRVMRPDGSVRWIYAKGRPLFGPDGRAVSALGVVIDLTERKESEERLQLLMREVDHRANNLMAVVQGAVALSRAGDAEELREIIIGRVEALARAHQLLAESRWRGADLRRLVEEELRPYALGDEARVRIGGPPAPLTPAAAQGVAMALHELATNAAKHGALSVPTGSVSVEWRVGDEGLRISWRESGGPAVHKPAKAGFGTTVLQRALGGPVGGGTAIEWRPEGLACELNVPELAGAD